MLKNHESSLPITLVGNILIMTDIIYIFSYSNTQIFLELDCESLDLQIRLLSRNISTYFSTVEFELITVLEYVSLLGNTLIMSEPVQ